MGRSCRGLSLTLLLATIGRTLALDHGQVSQLNNGCRDQLNNIWTQYYSLPITDGQYDCKQLLSDALANQNGVGCPAYEDMIGCITASALQQHICRLA